MVRRVSLIELADDPVASWDEEIVHLVASGLARLAERVRADSAVRVPYPSPLQRAVNRMTVMCRVRGLEPPASVAELLRIVDTLRATPDRIQRFQLKHEHEALVS